MEEKPKITVTRTRRGDSATREFSFRRDQLRAGGVDSYRARAWEAFQRQSLPDTTLEAWRRTDIRHLPADKFSLPPAGAFLDLPPVRTDLLEPLADGQHGGQIVLLPGGATVELDEKLAAQGVIFTDLLTAEQKYPDLLARLMGQTVNPEEGKFAALAGALAQNGVVLYVPKGLQVEAPLHSILWGPGAFAHLSHLLVLVDEGASVTYVHEAASPDESGLDTLHAGLVEIQVMQNASLKFVELQSWGKHVWNFSHERVRVERGGSLDWIFGAIGSRLTKNFSELDLAGEGATGRMSGFYFTDGNQHLDHDTQQNHLAPHTTSDLLFKGALKGKSRSVWQGMIYVAPGAQKTDGYQANRNLILDEHSRADSLPGLEILADDVRCTHGATVGRMEAEPLFYLKSRGIPQAEAEKLVVEGFFDPIFQRIPFEGVRARFQQYISDKMS
ncbi:MAG: Fe-S cluster assembly protein SufD [Anaerolineae bacterium CG_4_9_14_3_um_filter_57_17]|nr:Fe-S cluster assembly protein SufD [bacterium]NCT21589.1 Fe-S cluster assembly protein SufD [bacterium]OIO87285.1 MAG: Fe-S cluster assembly protein SufD [Anaerolineae bacterium CG2_30_57_67]PJB67769.1 MAG: Fe-S cluster assembly protein SufD [Anaerolineae bacterium CG_4_9_14_3_um_filter_57_17]